MYRRFVLPALIFVMVNLSGLGAAVVDSLNEQREPGRRLAIVIGNDTYEGAPLNAARNDARSMARVLTELGFSVTLLQDATWEMIAAALATVGGKIRADDVALLYFSGHGAQVDGENFLVPVDFKSFTTEALRLGTIRANEVLKIFERARVTILVLDACRVNPFSGDRIGGRGLAADGGPRQLDRLRGRIRTGRSGRPSRRERHLYLRLAQGVKGAGIDGAGGLPSGASTRLPGDEREAISGRL